MHRRKARCRAPKVRSVSRLRLRFQPRMARVKTSMITARYTNPSPGSHTVEKHVGCWWSDIWPVFVGVTSLFGALCVESACDSHNNGTGLSAVAGSVAGIHTWDSVRLPVPDPHSVVLPLCVGCHNNTNCLTAQAHHTPLALSTHSSPPAPSLSFAVPRPCIAQIQYFFLELDLHGELAYHLLQFCDASLFLL